MKRNLLVFNSLIILLFFIVADMFAQSAWFDNGTIGVKFRNYGEIEIYSPVTMTDTLYQIDRLSTLGGVSSDSVFSWRTDQDWEDQPVLVSSPQFSDYEIFGSVNNLYSLEPPDILIKMNLYGWQTGGYTIMKFTIINRESIPLSLYFGFEIIPETDGEYGFETIHYLPSQDAFSIYRDSTQTGFKFLNSPLGALRVFEWYSGYDDIDDSLYTWLSYGAVDTLYISTNTEGTVEIPSIDETTIPAGDSLVSFLAIAVGNNESNMLGNLASAVQQYNNIFTSLSTGNESLPREYSLLQNYPNPFNPSTIIGFQVPRKEKVNLSVFNAVGQKIAVLLDGEVPAGNHQVTFNAADYPGGIYFYKLTTDDFTETKKMLLIK